MKLKGGTYSKEVMWAARYILEKADGRELHSEQVVSIVKDGVEVTFGSVDAYCEGELFDLKTGRVRDYGPQMAAYALGIMQQYDLKEVTYHIVYSKYREAIVNKISLEEAMHTVYSIVDSVDDPTRSPWLCDYCQWCSREESCTAIKNFGYSIGGQIELLKQQNLDESLDPAVKQRLLSIVGTVVRWAEYIKEKVKEK